MENREINRQVQENLAPKCSCEKKRGRPPKKDYDSNALMQELIDIVAEVYQKSQEIKATAMELSLPPNKVKKLLITGNVISYPETENIQALLQQGKTIEEIQENMGLSYSTINTYLPYTKVIYKMSEISQNAERIKRYKERKQAIADLKKDCTEENCGNVSLLFGIIYSILLLDFLLLTHLRLDAAVNSQKSCSSTDERTVNLWHGARLKLPLRGQWRNRELYLTARRPLRMSEA